MSDTCKMEAKDKHHDLFSQAMHFAWCDGYFPELAPVHKVTSYDCTVSWLRMWISLTNVWSHVYVLFCAWNQARFLIFSLTHSYTGKEILLFTWMRLTRTLLRIASGSGVLVSKLWAKTYVSALAIMIQCQKREYMRDSLQIFVNSILYLCVSLCDEHDAGIRRMDETKTANRYIKCTTCKCARKKKTLTSTNACKQTR